MEQERLARLKRRAQDELASNDISNQVKKTQTTPPVPHSTANSKSNESSMPTTQVNSKPDQSHLPFPRGVIRRTYSSRHAREGDITIEEVLLKENLKIGVFGSFMWEMEWLISKLNVRESRFFMAMMSNQGGDPEPFKRQCEENVPPSVRLFWPPMNGAGNMHSKFMLLVFPEFLRIVITSANLTPFDWGETGVLENVVFLIDLPRLEREEKVARENLTPFGEELLYYLEKSKLPEQVLGGILKFDFTATSDIAFIHSVGGSSFGSDLNRTGLNGLAKAVNQLNLTPQKAENLQLEYATASIGALNDSLLRNLHNAACGIYEKGAVARSKSTSIFEAKVRDLIRVYFPSQVTVAKSQGGPDSAGTICFRDDYYRKATFPKDVLRDHISTRKGLLSHSKIILAHSNNTAWIYLGSHNLSESAWGKVSKDRQRNEQKMVCRNWECGVLLPVFRNPNQESEGHRKVEEPSPNMNLRSTFSSMIDVPFEVPGRPYKTNPWFYNKASHSFG
jgi:tyrosyl-DNA phosphodiesterase